MIASFNDRLEGRFYLRLDLLWLANAMLFTLAFIWIVNIIVLVTFPPVTTKSTPCFSDGDCPSAQEKCVYGSWKGLGNCHRKTRDSMKDLRIMRSDRRNSFRNKRLVRRKRNPSSVWNDSYLSQKRWDVWLPAKQRNKANTQHPKTAFQQNTNERFDEIAADLIRFGRSHVTYQGINYTVAVIPVKEGAPAGWLVTLIRDNFDADSKRNEDNAREHPSAKEDSLAQKRQHVSTDTQDKVESMLLENSFGSSHTADAVVNISIRYPVSVLSRPRYGGSSDIRFRFRRQLPRRLTDLSSVDPLISQMTNIEPMIPAAEDIFGKNMGKRSAHSRKEMQRIRRELEEIEDESAPLPKVVRNPDVGPIIIEDLFNDNGGTFRKKRQHKESNINGLIHNRVARHKRHHKTKKETRPIKTTRSTGFSGRSKRRTKRKPPRSASLLRNNKKAHSDHAVKNRRDTVMQRVKEQVFKGQIAKRSQKNTGKAARKPSAGGHPGNPTGKATGGNTTTEPPDPFASLKNRKEPHIDYYDVSKRMLLKDEDDMDPESSLDEDESDSSPDDDDEEVDNVQEEEKRKKRQTLAEELEDEDEQTMPSWRETVELLRRANTFAVPAHDSTGHVVLVRRVRDLGALDLGESLVKLKETMAKIFGRCSPARRRKRSHHVPPPEVVTDRLSNDETWEIQGQGHEMVDQAKIDVHMDDDKPYNVTTVLRPMGKRSFLSGRNKQQRNALQQTKMALHAGKSGEMRDILEQNARLDEIPGLKRVKKKLKRPGLNNARKIARGNERLAFSKRNEESVPVGKDVHMEAQKGSPVKIDLTIDEKPGAAQPVAEVQSNNLTISKSKTAPSKRNEHRQQVYSSSSTFSNSGQSSMASGVSDRRKTVREPYIITRRYNTPKKRPSRAEVSGRRTRGLDATAGGLDRANLLYLADGDPLPSSWRAAPANVKRDVDVEVEVETAAGNNTNSTTSKETNVITTTAPPSTVKATIEVENDEEIFSGKSSVKSSKRPTSLEASASLKTGQKAADPTSVVFGVSSGSPVGASVINLSPPRPKSVLTVTSDDRRPTIEETISSAGDQDWGVSGSSDRLMSLISGIEKALRVPLGGTDTSRDQVTLIDDSSDSVQTEVIRSQPEITQQKASYTYSVNGPQPPVVVATTTQEKKPDVVKMDITAGTATKTGELNENIYLKGFEPPRKPAKPLFVDAAAKKMIWVEPSYKTVVSSEFPKRRLPLSYVRLYNGAVPRITPVDQWTQITNIKNLDSDTLGDVKIGNEDQEQVTVEKLTGQPSGASITDIHASKTTEVLQPPRLVGVQRNVLLSGQLIGNAPPPERDKDTVVEVKSSVSSDNSDSPKATVFDNSPTVAVRMDGRDDDTYITGSKNMPSNIRILHKGTNADGQIVATIGSQNSFKTKKDLQQFSEASQIPVKHQRLLSSNGVILSEQRLNRAMKDAAAVPMQGDKRSGQHIYRVPNTGISNASKRRVNTKGLTATSKRASANPAQAAPVVHTYSKDPGVQGATMEMMNDLASRLTSQNAQRRTSPASSRRSVACATGGSNCRRKRRTRLSKAASGVNMKNYDMSSKPQQLSRLDAVPTRLIKKRDVSRTVFEQPKVFIVSPKTILEAPGTKYKFIDPQERNDKHLKIYTISNVSSSTDDEAPDEKSAAGGDSANGADEQFSHGGAESLPMSHEKALQEAESKARFKIVDSSEGFSVEAPSFDKKITSGGQISEDRMVPVPVEVGRNEVPHDENRISVTTDVQQHKHMPGVRVNAIETTDSGSSPTSQHKTQAVEYVESPETGPDSHGHSAEIIQLTQENTVPNERKKRRISNIVTNNRKSREEKIQALRTELQNLNNIGSKLGLNFFDKSSIDIIVREVSNQGRAKVSRGKKLTDRRAEMINAKHKRKSKNTRTTIDSSVENAGRIPLKAGKKRYARKQRTKHASSLNDRHSPLDEHALSKDSEKLENSNSNSYRKLKRNNHKSTPGHDRRRNTVKSSHQYVPSKRTMRSSYKSARDVESDTENNAEVEVAPAYYYSNKVKNDHPLVISNPEKHDWSDNREREETLTVSNKDTEPMEITAILRGRRKRRDIRPDEFFRPSRDDPLYRRSIERRMVAPLSPALTGQWQKQFAPAQVRRDEGRGQLNEATPVVRSLSSGEPNQRGLGVQSVGSSPRTGPEQQAVSAPSFPQRLSNAGMDTRKQIINAFPSQRNLGLQSRRIAKVPSKTVKNIDTEGIAGYGTNNILINEITDDNVDQGPSNPTKTVGIGQKEIPFKASNATKQESPGSPRKSKGPEMGVWKKLGEIFDISPKETLRPDMEITVPTTTSPAPLQVIVPAVETVPGISSRTEERDGSRRQPEASSRTETSEGRAKSGLRAAIVDRLLQDLRKMASARGSEMARAESDLIEILHDYQTDLMDEDEKTITGEPFQGVRIHDNVAIPMVYQAVPIKTESLSQHRLVVRSSRDTPSGWDDDTYNPP